MLALLFTILLFIIFGKILIFALKMTWEISKIICSVVLLPIVLVVLVLVGLMKLALPILIIIGIISLFALRD